MHCKITAQVDGGMSDTFQRGKMGSDDPHQREQKYDRLLRLSWAVTTNSLRKLRPVLSLEISPDKIQTTLYYSVL